MNNKLLEKYIDNNYTRVLNDNTSFENFTYKEYISKSNSYFDEKLDDLFVHSTFILDDNKFVHKIDELDLLEKRLMQINIFDNNEEFKNKLLFPLIIDFINKYNIKSIEMMPYIKNNTMYTLSIFEYNGNILSIENITKTFAREIIKYINDNKKEDKVIDDVLDKEGKITLTIMFIIISIITIICGIILACEMI